VASEPVDIAPLQGLTVPALGANGELNVSVAAPAAGAAGPVLLPLPSGDVRGFGYAVAATTDGEYDYVVVAASAAGRVFVYRKAYTSSSFQAPEQLPLEVAALQPSVAIDNGRIAVGVPAQGAVFTFSQARDSRGYILRGSSFSRERENTLPTRIMASQGSSVGFGSALSWAPYSDGPLVTCNGSRCETRRDAFQRPFDQFNQGHHWLPDFQPHAASVGCAGITGLLQRRRLDHRQRQRQRAPELRSSHRSLSGDVAAWRVVLRLCESDLER